MNVSLENLGTVNKNRVHLETRNGRIDVYFSYATPVSFNAVLNGGVTVNGGSAEVWTRQNDWGNTTGKFLNTLEPNKANRISGVEFERRLEEALNQL